MPRKTLQSASHIKRYLCNLALKLEKGDIDGQTASKIAYVLSVALKAMETSDIETKLAELESLLTTGKDKTR